MIFLEDLNNLDLGFGFLVNICVYSRLETSGTPPNLVHKSPNLVLNKFLVKPDQGVKKYVFNDFWLFLRSLSYVGSSGRLVGRFCTCSV